MGPVDAIREIQEQVARHFRVPVKELLQHRRSTTVDRARAFAVWAARERLECSLSELGSAFRREHHAMSNACRVVEAALFRKDRWAVRAREAIDE